MWNIHRGRLRRNRRHSRHLTRLSRAERTPAVQLTRHRFRRCTSILDALTSSSNEESVDVKKCKDLSVKILYKSEEVDTLAKSEIALSDHDFPVVSGVRDIRKVVRRQEGPLDGPTRGPARPDSRQELSAPVVDLVTGKCKPGKALQITKSPTKIPSTASCTINQSPHI